MNYWPEVLTAIAAPLTVGVLYYWWRITEAKRTVAKDAERFVLHLVNELHVDPRSVTGATWDKTRGVTVHTRTRSYSQRGG